YYYSAFFSRRAKAFDIEAMAGGKDRIQIAIRDLQNKVQMKTSTNKDQDVLNCLQLVLEASARGVKFKQIDINNSAAYDFIVNKEDNSLLIPFSALDSLGGATAESIVEERNKKPFTSKKDVLNRTKINSTQLDKLDELGAFGDLADDEDNSFGLF
ncbi:MAG: PolC-type DNA polymerase III, partial [Bacilli bacterium]|nr:PolC-type DNA polymerase III [Bacilli bacterium]